MGCLSGIDFSVACAATTVRMVPGTRVAQAPPHALAEAAAAIEA
ncbi:hypothetical protein [Sphingomonas sp.]|jgi:hypothetical protein